MLKPSEIFLMTKYESEQFSKLRNSRKVFYSKKCLKQIDNPNES